MEENATKKDIQDVLEAINGFAENTDSRFARLEADVNTIKAAMVTKAYFDDKLSDQQGNMVAMVRKEDTKTDVLTGILAQKSILTQDEAKEIKLMGAFPKAI